MVRNLDTEIFKKLALHGHDFPEQQNFLAPTGQLSIAKWVWDKIVGADTALEYVNRGIRWRAGAIGDNVRKQSQMQVS